MCGILVWYINNNNNTLFMLFYSDLDSLSPHDIKGNNKKVFIFIIISTKH